ncbi:DUF4189 domain-containing protein [Rhodoplanes sp. TEM]|uniref:DUF4189 domain-containing protein n=1 Tax=Rhodoplanes tepidamans TaxID=200616 RepID=A0ABT5JDU1_RHOTP|nr:MULTISPECIES: DUF4189 domain-containing protein [Rhodoplanes]MDC7787673.1 DUF4189 domain-containing protein [Rhodoplanes tepidamans]MDC7985941.1 DUF4189 domain-containing protein [Rhodoplanes sp. TEM]MDQ0355246.1 hypothetical protein [Rhodoplanes tepidamans]
MARFLRGAAAIVALVLSAGAVQGAGAIAIGACGAYGYAYDLRTLAEAERAALKRCHGRNCRVVATVRRGCTAFAVDAKDLCGAHGYAVGSRLAAAQNRALQQCYAHGGKTCVIRAFACDARN